ncbi:MAG TPA: CDP-glucose 4,6-dehydratase, partial [Burkholderiaceae bacterium]|nr:CDP-glucose 4,6-dehydratase [Burkholderiaceae bacterium]
ASKAGAYNFGPWTSEAASVREVVEMARAGYGAGQWQAGDGSEGPHEAGWLALEIVKARHMLGVAPRWNLSTAVERTMAWYRRSDDGNDARSLCEADISAWEEQA